MLYELVYVDIVDMGKRNFCTLLDFVQFFPEISKNDQKSVKDAYLRSVFRLNQLIEIVS
jgi:hypothetical protein